MIHEVDTLCLNVALMIYNNITYYETHTYFRVNPNDLIVLPLYCIAYIKEEIIGGSSRV